MEFRNLSSFIVFHCSDHLKIHVKTHDTRKPFQCSVCQRGYSTAAALTSHLLNHRRESGSRCGSLCSSSSSASSASTTASSSALSVATPNGRSESSTSSCPASPPPTPTNDAPVTISTNHQPPPSPVTPHMEPPSGPSISQYQVKLPSYSGFIHFQLLPHHPNYFFLNSENASG